MMLLITFMPWILFWAMMAMHLVEPAAVTAGIASLIIIIINARQGRSVKIFQVMIFMFFFAVSITAIFMDLEYHWLWVRIASSLFFAVIALVSIVIKKPFTLPYAREQVPKEMWGTSKFMRINYVVSWTWFFVFIAYLIVPVLRLFNFDIPKVAGSLFAVIIALTALKFSFWYMRHMVLTNK